MGGRVATGGTRHASDFNPKETRITPWSPGAAALRPDEAGAYVNLLADEGEERVREATRP